MGKFDEAFSRGDLPRRVRNLERAVRLMAGGRDLESASIGADGLRIVGGHLQILDTAGNVTMTLATDGLSLAGLLEVLGNIDVTGGSIRILDADGNPQMTLATSGLTLDGTLQVVGSIEVDGGAIIVRDSGGNEVFRADENGVSLEGLLSVLGDIEVDASGEIRSSNFSADTAGYRLRGDGILEVNQLILRDGIIGDDKLTNLVRTDTRGSTLDTESVSSVESTSLALSVPSWATDVDVLAIGSAYLAGIADSPSMEIYCTIEGNEGIHMAGHVDRASGNATAHHQRSIATSVISGNLNVSLTAEVNTPGDAFGLRLALSVIVVWAR